MTRKHVWLLAVLVVVGLVGAAVVWAWYKHQRASTAVDALIAELEEHGEQTERQAASLPDNPDRLAERMREVSDRAAELTRRAEEVIPTAPERKRDQLRDALARYVVRLDKARDEYLRRAEQWRTKPGAP